MQKSILSQVQIVNPLIKLVKEREQIYFQLLGFVNSHLTSSSNDLDNTSVFNKFIALIDSKHQNLVKKELQFMNSLADPFAEGQEIDDDPISKEMLRLFLRLLQILEASIQRVRRSVFEDNGRAVRQYNSFRTNFNKIIKQQFFIAKDFAQHVIGYCTRKYTKQFQKLKKYIQKVRQGDDIWFRQLYSKEKSDIQSSPSPDDKRAKEIQKTVRKVIVKKIDMDKHLSSTEQPEKRQVPVKKTARPAKRRMSKNRSKDYEEQDLEQEPTKKKTANKLYHFYVLMELNKKQFFEDYVYEKIDEEKHRRELYTKLFERNKTINYQINVHVRKSINAKPKYPNKSHGESCDQRHQSNASRTSLRKSFVISKRKNSHNNFQTSTQKYIHKQVESDKKDMKSTIKNFNPRRRSSQSSQRQKSKKLVVLKAPMLFEEEVIPQAPINQTQWLQAPLTVKGRDKKNDNIRLKRKNNVNPLQNACLQQNFRYPL